MAELSRGATKLLALLRELERPLTHAEIAAALECAESSLRRFLRELRREGLLSTRQQGRSAAVYTVIARSSPDQKMIARSPENDRPINEAPNENARARANSEETGDLSKPDLGRVLSFPPQAQLPGKKTEPGSTLPASISSHWETFSAAWPKNKKTKIAHGELIWFQLWESGVITEANFGEVLAGLERWKDSEQLNENNGRFIHAIPKWLF